MTETLAELVRRRRAELGMNQTQLGELLGLSGKAGQTAVSDIERGVTKWPDADKRRRLAKALGVTHIAIIVATGELEESEVPVEGAPRQLFPDNDMRLELVELLQEVDPLPGSITLRNVKTLLEAELIDQERAKEMSQ